jgi:hypothetical protein
VKRALALAYAVALVPAIFTALLQPVWNLVDEADHFDMVAQLATGGYPRVGETFIRPETLAISASADSWAGVPSGTVPPPSHQTVFDQLPPGLTRAQRDLWLQRHLWQYSKEVAQAPLFYAVAVPVFSAGERLWGALGAVYALRVANALLAALLAPLAVLLAWRLLPGSRVAAVIAGALAVVIPGPLIDHTHVTSDTLGAVLASAALVIAIGRHEGSSPTWRRALVVGFVLGLATLTRFNAAVLVPACALALATHSTPRKGVIAWVLMAAATALTVAPWIVLNVLHFGTFTQLSSSFAWSPVPPPPNDPYWWALGMIELAGGYFAAEPFGVLPGTFWVSASWILLAVFAAAGILRLATGRVGGADRRILAVLLTAEFAAVLAAAAFPALSGTQVMQLGRYAYVALPAALALFAVGLVTELQRGAFALLATGVLAVVSIVAVTAFLARPTPGPIGPGHPSTSLSAPVSAQASFGTLSVALVSCAADQGGDLWIDVRAENSGSGPIDWSPAPEVQRSGNVLAVADYSRSTQLPGTLEAGQVVAGWLRLGPATQIRGHPSVAVVFRDVAENGYRQIGDLVLVTTLC